jgi:hypothetical protein
MGLTYGAATPRLHTRFDAYNESRCNVLTSVSTRGTEELFDESEITTFSHTYQEEESWGEGLNVHHESAIKPGP